MFSFTSRRSRIGSIGVALAAAAVAVTGSSLGTTSVGAPDRASSAERTYDRLAAGSNYKRLDLLAINDFHGNLEKVSPTSSSGRINNTAAGGVAYLATHLRELRQQTRAAGGRSITVAAGDLIGASPLLSAAFHDEPTIKAMNRIGLQVASVGNHEFDEGWRELKRMQRGGCLPDGDEGENNQNSCPPGQGFKGADFQYLAANVKWENRATHPRATILPPYVIKKVDGIKVGFIGMTLEGTPNIVTQAGIEGLEFTDEVETANSLVPRLRKKGVESIILLLHEGVFPADSTAYDNCNATGPAATIAQELKPAIDAIISGHTHQAYNCTIPDPAGEPRLLTSASSFGRIVTRMHLLLDPATGDVVREASFAQNRIVTNDEDGLDSNTDPDSNTEPAGGLVQLIEVYKTLVEPIANEVIGHLDPAGTQNNLAEVYEDDGEAALGNLIADAQLADDSTIPPDGPAAGEVPDIAFMNPGGIRADLIENEDGEVTYGAAFSVQPFNNYVVSKTFTGQQILDLLNEQFNGDNEGDSLEDYVVLQVAGITYTWDESLAAQEDVDAIVPGSVMINGAPLVVTDNYRVVMNSFLEGGGDGFPTFRDGANTYFGGLDIDSLSEYLTAHDPYTPVATDRISSVE